MAMDKNGQLYFTFEDINRNAERLNSHMEFLRIKSDINSIYIVSDSLKERQKAIHRLNRIMKQKSYVYSELNKLLNESMLEWWKGFSNNG